MMIAFTLNTLMIIIYLSKIHNMECCACHREATEFDEDLKFYVCNIHTHMGNALIRLIINKHADHDLNEPENWSEPYVDEEFMDDDDDDDYEDEIDDRYDDTGELL